MSLEARHWSDCACGAEVLAAEDGAGLADEAGGWDCASAGMIITEASNPAIKSLERMDNLQVGGYTTLTNASPICLFLEPRRSAKIFFAGLLKLSGRSETPRSGGEIQKHRNSPAFSGLSFSAACSGLQAGRSSELLPPTTIAGG